MFIVKRVDRIFAPRTQKKYMAELEDMTGLCEQKCAPPTLHAHTHYSSPCQPRPTHARSVTPIDGIDALRVESYEGLNVNEYLLYHGAPSSLIERLQTQGLDPRYAGEHFGKLFGTGVYLATNSSWAGLSDVRP